MSIKKQVCRSIAAVRIAMYSAKAHGDYVAAEMARSWLLGFKSALLIFLPKKLVKEYFEKAGLPDLDEVKAKIKDDGDDED